MLERVWQQQRWWRAALGLAVVIGAVARARFALVDHGIYWPDEVYQSLEPAHRMVFGYSMLAWEFVVGARNVLLPGLIAAPLKLFALTGLDDPTLYVPVTRLLFVAASVGTVLGVRRLALAVRCSPATTAAAVTAFSLMNLAIYFSPRAMSEVASALPVTWGLALLLEAPSRRKLVLAASLLGVAVLLRIHTGLFAVGGVVVLLAQRRWRDAGLVFGVLAGWALVYGLLDLASWGGFLHSGLYYLRFNLIEGRAAEWGRAPPGYYTGNLVRSLGALWVLLAVFSLVGLRRAPAVVALALAFLFGHMALPHKELRFIVPMLPLVCVGAAAGLDELFSRSRPLAMAGLVALLLSSVGSLATFGSLTRRDVGRGDDVSAFDDGGPVTRLLLRAHRERELCGLALLAADRGATFVYFALHRNVPLYDGQSLPKTRSFNYVIADHGTQAGDVIAEDHGVELVRTSRDACEPDPAFEPFLDERTRALAHGPESRL